MIKQHVFAIDELTPDVSSPQWLLLPPQCAHALGFIQARAFKIPLHLTAQ